MNTNPINLTVRFLLEIAMLMILAYWGWHLFTDAVHFVTAIGLPVAAAVLWGIFRINNDPKPAPVAIPGILRLLFELGLFALSVWILSNMHYNKTAFVFGAIVIIHYIVSYDRTWAMLRNKPYNGFTKKSDLSKH